MVNRSKPLAVSGGMRSCAEHQRASSIPKAPCIYMVHYILRPYSSYTGTPMSSKHVLDRFKSWGFRVWCRRFTLKF